MSSTRNRSVSVPSEEEDVSAPQVSSYPDPR